jgi:beta-xylosidase
LVHGFPLDWNHWQIHEWPDQLAEIRAVTSLPLWYSLYDLPRAWPATTRHREAEGSSYYRHFYMGLLREDGSPKLAIRRFHELTPAFGICQWFHFEDHRLDRAVQWLKDARNIGKCARQPEAFADFCAAQVRKYC